MHEGPPMMLLDAKEKEFITNYITLAVNCPARFYSDMLAGGAVSREYLLDMEIFMGQISEHCHERWMFRRLYEDYRLRAGTQRVSQNDPVIQELDRSSLIAGWWRNIKQGFAGLKEYVIFR